MTAGRRVSPFPFQTGGNAALGAHAGRELLRDASSNPRCSHSHVPTRGPQAVAVLSAPVLAYSKRVARHSHAGNSSMNVAPCPRRLSHRTVPDIASASRFTMDNPRPLEDSPPVGLALSRANLPNIFLKSSSPIP